MNHPFVVALAPNRWVAFGGSCSTGAFRFHSFQGSFFLDRENGWFLERTMVDKNGESTVGKYKPLHQTTGGHLSGSAVPHKNNSKFRLQESKFFSSVRLKRAWRRSDPSTRPKALKTNQIMDRSQLLAGTPAPLLDGSRLLQHLSLLLLALRAPAWTGPCCAARVHGPRLCWTGLCRSRLPCTGPSSLRLVKSPSGSR